MYTYRTEIKLELPITDKLSYRLFHSIILLPPPSKEVSIFHITTRKLSVLDHQHDVKWKKRRQTEQASMQTYENECISERERVCVCD